MSKTTKPAAAPAVDEAAVKPAAPKRQVKARCLRDSPYGMCDQVVMVDAEIVDSLFGIVDANPDAVAYAESLAK